jgi:hypothetical protein
MIKDLESFRKPDTNVDDSLIAANVTFGKVKKKKK